MIGFIQAFAGRTDKIPKQDGWVLCDGRALSRKDFSDLFNVLGILHGGGDGVNTFNIPDYRGYFLRGASMETTVDPEKDVRLAPAAGGATGNEIGTMQSFATAMPRNAFANDMHGGHSHGDPTWNGGPGPFELAVGSRGPGGFDYGAQSAPTTVNGAHTHTISGGDRESRPVNKYVHWLIKTK